MNLFVNYIQPLNAWLFSHPYWALFFTFLISLTESLAIIGSIVPGTVTMTAIGILAGSGIMRIDLTLVAATLGAIAGDSLSYAIGYHYSEQLSSKWPFSKYPTWLNYGKEFFLQHGGKSVLIGRFFGPLRSIIPVIAGIMHMKQWRFLIANVLSAIGWSISHIIPGVLIGAASNELSAENATRLFMFILVLLAVFWLISIGIKWSFAKINLYLKKNFHKHWCALKQHPHLFRLIQAITPANEENHYPTMILFFSILFCWFCTLVLIFLTLQSDWIITVNLPTHLLFQSFRTSHLDVFFIACAQLTSSLSLISLFVIGCVWLVYKKNSRTIYYIISLISITSVICLFLAHFIHTPRPAGLLVSMHGWSFPDVRLGIGTAFYGFILFYINNKYAYLTNLLRTFIFSILGLSGLSAIYLGDFWLTDVLGSYFIGTLVCLVHWIIFRKYKSENINPAISGIVLFCFIGVVLVSTSISTCLHLKTLKHNHEPYRIGYILDETSWWNQNQTLLPLYQLNRIGRRISLFNIQFSGDLPVLEEGLKQAGWASYQESFLKNLLTRINNNPENLKLPLLAQLYQNKKPELMMTYEDMDSHWVYILRIWESNFYLHSENRPIWIGSIQSNNLLKSPKIINPNELEQTNNPLLYILPGLKQFKVKQLEIPKDQLKTTVFTGFDFILLIKNKKPKK